MAFLFKEGSVNILPTEKVIRMKDPVSTLEPTTKIIFIDNEALADSNVNVSYAVKINLNNKVGTDNKPFEDTGTDVPDIF